MSDNFMCCSSSHKRVRSLTELTKHQLLSLAVRKISGADDEADAAGRNGGHGSSSISGGSSHGVPSIFVNDGEILFPDMPASTGSIRSGKNGSGRLGGSGGSGVGNFSGGSTSSGSVSLTSNGGSGSLDWRGLSGRSAWGSGGGSIGFDPPVGRSGRGERGNASFEDSGGGTGKLHHSSSLRNIFGSLQNGRKKAPSRAR